MKTNNKNNKFQDNIKVTPYKNLQRLREDEDNNFKKKPNHLLTVTMVFVLISFALSSLALGIGGVDGKNGLDGLKGLIGINGNNGKDGSNGQDGKNGSNGSNGNNGQDGKNPPITFTSVPERFWGEYNIFSYHHDREEPASNYLFLRVDVKANEITTYQNMFDDSGRVITYPLYYGTDLVGSFVRAYLPLRNLNVIMSIDFTASIFCNNANDEWAVMESQIYRFSRAITWHGSPR